MRPVSRWSAVPKREPVEAPPRVRWGSGSAAGSGSAGGRLVAGEVAGRGEGGRGLGRVRAADTGAQQAHADGVLGEVEEGLAGALGALQRDSHTAGVSVERVPELEVRGAREVGGRAEPRRADHPDLVPLRPLLQSRAPSRDLRPGRLVRRARLQELAEPLGAGSLRKRRSRLLQDAPGEASPRRLGAPGEGEQDGDLRDPRPAELAGTGVEHRQARGPRRRRRQGSEKSREPLQQRHERGRRFGRQRLQRRLPDRRRAG